MAYLIREDGSVKEVHPKDAEEGFSLAEVYDYLKCSCIEIVRCPSGAMLVIDEEGKLKDRDPNMKATIFAGSYPFDIIVGPALYCTEGEIQ